jgi:hypothetical protein
VAVYGNVAFCTDELAHIVFIVPVVVIVGNGLILTDTACVAVHPFAFVMVMDPLYVPPGVLAEITIVFKLPPAAAKANNVLPWSASPAVLAAASQSMLYDVGLLVVAVYGKVAVCTDELEHNALIVPVVVIVGKGLIVMVTAWVEVHGSAFVIVMVPDQVPPLVLAGMTIVFKLPPPATKANNVFP